MKRSNASKIKKKMAELAAAAKRNERENIEDLLDELKILIGDELLSREEMQKYLFTIKTDDTTKHVTSILLNRKGLIAPLRYEEWLVMTKLDPSLNESDIEKLYLQAFENLDDAHKEKYHRRYGR